ncbi:MAG TPA: hypothetical protein VMV15_14145 [Candidatus Binataceae bacterium]|nr:hypothetical protein [Candidatus Binataceae bacterium]
MSALLLLIATGVQAKNVSVQIKGAVSSPSTGVCATGYAAQCASGNCYTIVPAGPIKVSGTFGKGTVTAMCVTLDVGNNVSEADTNDTCGPIFGDLLIEVSVTKKHVTTVTDTAANITGAFCHHQANANNSMIEAGWAIDGADSTDTAATGWGTITGTNNKKTGVMLLNMKGSLTP